MRPGRVRREHFSQGMLYAGTLVGFSVQDDGDKTMLNVFRFERDAGLYAAGYRIVQMGLLPINSLLGSSHGRFLASDPERRNEHVERALRFTLIACAYGLVVAFITWFGADLVLKVFPADFEETATVMRVLVPLVVLRGASHFAFNGLLGLGRYRARVKLLAASAGTTLLLYLALIPSHSWKGAAAATLIGESLFVVLTWIVLLRAQREHDDFLNREPELARG
jgi:O-antigen/teichoic acid export membrane protein